MEPKILISRMTNMLGHSYWVVKSQGITGSLPAKMKDALLGVFSVGDRSDGVMNRACIDGEDMVVELYISDSHGTYPTQGHIHSCLRTVYFLETGKQAPWYEP